MFFTVHYLMLRGFYALERTRTVFWIQCAVAATNIVVAVLLVGRATAEQTSPALVLAYTAAYVVGSARPTPSCAARLGGLETADAGPVPGAAAGRRRRLDRRAACGGRQAPAPALGERPAILLSLRAAGWLVTGARRRRRCSCSRRRCGCAR